MCMNLIFVVAKSLDESFSRLFLYFCVCSWRVRVFYTIKTISCVFCVDRFMTQLVTAFTPKYYWCLHDLAFILYSMYAWIYRGDEILFVSDFHEFFMPWNKLKLHQSFNQENRNFLFGGLKTFLWMTYNKYVWGDSKPMNLESR